MNLWKWLQSVATLAATTAQNDAVGGSNVTIGGGSEQPPADQHISSDEFVVVGSAASDQLVDADDAKMQQGGGMGQAQQQMDDQGMSDQSNGSDEKEKVGTLPAAGQDDADAASPKQTNGQDTLNQAGSDKTNSPEPSRRPNVILLLAEDLGWGDLGSFGHPYAQTPTIDRLAEQGMKFTNFHAAGKTCSPARAGIMTSRHPASMEGYSGDYGFQHLTTVSDLFRDAGYPAVGHFGKWHIGEDLEREDNIYGFTDVKKLSGCESAYWYKDECVVDGALKFIEDNYQEPFFLNVWGHVAHSPIKPKQHLVDRFANINVDYSDFGYQFHDKLDKSKKLDKNLDRSMANYLGALYSMDYNIARILGMLDDLGIVNNTIVAFTGDHGAARIGAEEDSSTEQNMLGYCGGLRDYKHSYYEGGVRVPLIVKWPEIIPAGAVDDSPISALDWLPTISTLAQVPYKEKLFEGENFADVWLGGAGKNRSSPLFWNKEGSGDYAMLSEDGRWKLHFSVDDQWELYDLRNNIEEDVNLVRCKKDIADRMKKQLKEWTQTLPEKYCRLGKGCDPARFDKLDKGKDGDGPEKC